MDRCLQGFHGRNFVLDASKIDPRGSAGCPVRQTENDWNAGKGFVVRFNHELQRGWSDSNDDVWPTILVLANKKFAESLLVNWIREQDGIHVLTIKFQLVR